MLAVGRLTAAVALVGASVFIVGAPAGALDVSTEQQLRDAFGDVAETEVTLTADIDLTCAGGGEIDRVSGTDITLDGSGHTITQTCDGERVVFENGAGALTLANVTITGGNLSGGGSGGGGVFSGGGGLLTVQASTVSDNHATSLGGGGINTEDVRLVDSTVAGNTADDFGGAMNVVNATVINSTVSGNESTGRAGGIASGEVTIVNSTVSGNTAGRGPGGGVYVFSATLVYATVVDNTSPDSANIYAEEGITSIGSVVALADGGGGSCGGGGTTTTNGYNFSDDATCGLTDATDRQDAGSPGLAALADNGGPTMTRLPQTGSPLLDAIPLASCQADGASDITTDQRGITRPQGTGCDIGAVEVAVTGPPEPTTTPPSANAASVTPRFTG